MHLELGGEEAGDGGEDGAQHNADNQSDQHADDHGQGREIEGDAEHRAGVDALVHDDGGGGHAHADHTADGQVSAGQKDQTGNTQCQEHTGRSLLQDVQNIVDGQQRHVLDDGGDDAQRDEDDDDGDVQTVSQQESRVLKVYL